MRDLTQLDLEALAKSGDAILRLRRAVQIVNSIGFEMSAAVAHPGAPVRPVVERMARAADELVVAAAEFQVATRRALGQAEDS